MDDQFEVLLDGIDEDDYSVIEPFLFKLPFYSANVLTVKYDSKSDTFWRNGVTSHDISTFSDTPPMIVDILCDEGVIVMKLEETQTRVLYRNLKDKKYMCKWFGDDEYQHFEHVCKSVCDSFVTPFQEVFAYSDVVDLMYMSTCAKIMYCTSIYNNTSLGVLDEMEPLDEDTVKKVIIYIHSS